MRDCRNGKRVASQSDRWIWRLTPSLQGSNPWSRSFSGVEMVSTQIQQQTDACSGRPVGRSKLSGQNQTTTLLPWTSVRPRLLWRFNTRHPLADRCSLDRNQRRSEQNAVPAVRNLLDGGGDCNRSPLETCESLVCDVCVDAGSIPANSTNLPRACAG